MHLGRIARSGSIVAALGMTACVSGSGPVTGSATSARGCESLVGVTSGPSVVTAATPMAAGAQVGSSTVPAAICRVQGVSRPSPGSEINFEVWLPLDAAWTGRLKVDGTGGFAGATPVRRLADDVAAGFAAAGSDMGHVGGESPDWTMNNPEKVKDWGYRAHYYVTTAAKAVANAYYGRPVAHAYFEGCSNGGRQAMMMAQRYPELFDGIIAGAPSMFYPDTLMSIVWTGHTLTPEAGRPPVVSPAKLEMVGARAMAACDAQDGLVDQQITNPRACNFNPDVLRCQAEAAEDCLTDDELRALKAVYRGVPTPTGESRWHGPAVGSEPEWQPGFADRGGYGRFIGHLVYSQSTPPFAPRELDLVREYDALKRSLTPWFAAPSPDLTRFRARGGKLIQYHGWDDAVVTPQGSVNYARALATFEALKGLPDARFDAAVESLSAHDVAAAASAHGGAVQDYHRLFMLPHVAHCSGGRGPGLIGGGTGAPPAGMQDANHDLVLSLVRWVEQDVAPEVLIASKLTDGAITRQRPICAYPKEARYRGAGDINAASSFACVAPEGQPALEKADLAQIRNALRQRNVLSPTR